MNKKWKYILASGLGALLLFLTSLPYLFKNYIAIPALNLYVPEAYIYAFCVVFFPLVAVICAIITYKQEKYDVLDLIINYMIAFTLSMSLKAVDFAPVVSAIAVIGFVGLSILYLVVCLKKKKEEGFSIRIYVSNLRYVFALVFALMMMPSFISYVLLVTDKNESVIETQVEEDQREIYIKTAFKQENWDKLTIEEKYEAMKVGISYIIGELRLGEIEVRINDTPKDETIHAYYNSDEKYIAINEHYILSDEDSVVIFRTLCHESFHYYQYTMMDLYFQINDSGHNVMYPYFDQIRGWVEAHNSYEADRENYEDYINNKLESDANDYADEMVEKIFGENEN